MASYSPEENERRSACIGSRTWISSLCFTHTRTQRIEQCGRTNHCHSFSGLNSVGTETDLSDWKGDKLDFRHRTNIAVNRILYIFLFFILTRVRTVVYCAFIYVAIYPSHILLKREVFFFHKQILCPSRSWCNVWFIFGSVVEHRISDFTGHRE